MRLIFLPGFGETQHIFSQIAPHLPGNHLFVEHQELLGKGRIPSLNATRYAQLLIEQHQITQADRLIGHSMGGWIAFAIKQLTDCPIVQIASWTDPEKVVKPINRPELAYWLVQRGWLYNRFTRQLLLRNYRNKPSAQIFGDVFQHLIDSPADFVINQLQVILNPLESASDRMPERIIHSKKDSIVRFPDQNAIVVPGDHFNLFTHPEEVSRAMAILE